MNLHCSVVEMHLSIKHCVFSTFLRENSEITHAIGREIWTFLDSISETSLWLIQYRKNCPLQQEETDLKIREFIGEVQVLRRAFLLDLRGPLMHLRITCGAQSAREIHPMLKFQYEKWNHITHILQWFHRTNDEIPNAKYLELKCKGRKFWNWLKINSTPISRNIQNQSGTIDESMSKVQQRETSTDTVNFFVIDNQSSCIQNHSTISEYMSPPVKCYFHPQFQFLDGQSVNQSIFQQEHMKGNNRF